MIMLLELLPLHYSASTLYLLLHRFITYKPSYIKSHKLGNQKLRHQAGCTIYCTANSKRPLNAINKPFDGFHTL